MWGEEQTFRVHLRVFSFFLSGSVWFESPLDQAFPCGQKPELKTHNPESSRFITSISKLGLEVKSREHQL